MRRRRAAALLALVLVGVAAYVWSQRGAVPLRAPVARPMGPPPAWDPFAYRSSAASRYTARAIAGEAHVLFSASPGGAIDTAARVSRLRPLIDAAVSGTGIDPDLLEGLVFVESAGRPDAIGPSGAAGAAGLTQILPGTATTTMGMNVDLPLSEHLTQEIVTAESGGAPAAHVASLERRRARIDQRFDPVAALAGTVRYLELARARFGREDLAFVSYHMGMGNLDQVLSDYDGGTPVPYVQLFFDCAPDRHQAAYALLTSFADQSPLYWWRVLGATDIMHLYRTDRAALEHLNTLQSEDDSNALVLHPPDRTSTFADPAGLGRAYGSGSLVPLPSNPAQLGLAYDPSQGSLARQLHAPVGLYRGLQPTALRLLLELAAHVRALSRGAAPLIETASVVDGRYQALLGYSDPPEAAGWSFTIARHYVSGAQAGALQAMLDRLQALNLIAWSAYPSEIEVTVASDASAVIAHGV